MPSDPPTPQLAAFTDALARRILASPGFADDTDDPAGLPDFAAFLAGEAWPTLPAALRTASYATRGAVPAPDTLSLDSTPTSVADSLTSCGLCADGDGALAFLRRVLDDYVSDVCAPPPVWARTRTTECEICARAVPLTYHHLVPRALHAKALKRGWHAAEMLGAVAWLCRPCHTTVHGVASNEELARTYFTVEALLGREDIQRWAKYAAKQRWGVRRG
ncbi:hypothetical protein PsYK624_114790 [Phanerochaete sordida]|uniref:HNH domain-containing protein n=1 Tax=Phanerochaete sordida TaxID=48140 RepID=A0A9P3GIB4_9APHY|nr:hypothetical protein PsYK624_114790 [Phanerochaete sordida]